MYVHKINLKEKIIAGRIATDESFKNADLCFDRAKDIMGDKYLYKVLRAFETRKGKVKQTGALKGLDTAGFLGKTLVYIIDAKIRHKQEERSPRYIKRYGRAGSRRQKYMIPVTFSLHYWEAKRGFSPTSQPHKLDYSQLKALSNSRPLNYDSLYAINSKGFVVAREVGSLSIAKLDIIFRLMRELTSWKKHNGVFNVLSRDTDAKTFFHQVYGVEEEREMPAAQRGKYTRMWNTGAKKFCESLTFA